MEPNHFDLKPLTLADVLDEAFGIFRDQFPLLFGIGAILYVSTGLLTEFIFASWISDDSLVQLERFLETGTGTIDPSLYYAAIVGTIMSLFALFALIGASTRVVANHYREQQSTLIASFAFLLARTVPFLLTVVAIGILLSIGLALLIVPGVILLVICIFVPSIFVVEKRWGMTSISRSRVLAKGMWGSILLVGLMALISSITASFVGATVAFGLFGPAFLLASIASGLTQALILPVFGVAFALLYVDSRVRKESFTLDQLITELTSTSQISSPDNSDNSQADSNRHNDQE